MAVDGIAASPSYKLILASGSTSRARLLREAGYSFIQLSPPFEDPPQPILEGSLSIEQLAINLSLAKALSILPHLPSSTTEVAIVLSADTICVGNDGLPLGKPIDRCHARSMVSSFRNNVHDVVTGVTLVRIEGRHRIFTTFQDRAQLSFGPLEDEKIEEYLDSDLWQGKAGGYDLFDRQAAGWSLAILAGSDPTTIVGLPMRRISSLLREWGIYHRRTQPSNVDDDPGLSTFEG